MYGTRSRSPVHHQLYNCATQDPAAFHAVLAYSAQQLDSMSDVQISKRALRHSSQTLRLIHERIREPLFKCDDGLVMAIAFLAFTEVNITFMVSFQYISILTIDPSAGLEIMRLLNGTGLPWASFSGPEAAWRDCESIAG
jgi:hypothetical protein